jgi:O-glycosyl hydrolase
VIRLDGMGLSDMRLVGPDTASAGKASTEYLQALSQDSLVMSRMAHFGIHSYDGGSGGTAEALSKSSHPGLDYWVTEFSGPCPGCDTGSPNPAEWPSAAQTASLAIKLLQEGASGLMQYDAWDGYYEHHESVGYWGLLAYDPAEHVYSPRKSYFVLRQLIRYTPRNAVRIAASSSNESVDVVAFQDPASGRVTVFGRNASDLPVKVSVRLAGLSGTTRLSVFITDSGRDMNAVDDALMAEGTTNLTVGPNSVFTLTGSATKG